MDAINEVQPSKKRPTVKTQGDPKSGARAGQRLRRVLRDPATGVRTGPLCFASRGFSLHAATRITADNRLGLEQLCRYVARPALAAGQLRIIDADQLSFALKTPWSDGTTHLVLSPIELLEKLAALVPPPRLNLKRYHGILAPSVRGRAWIVPRDENQPHPEFTPAMPASPRNTLPSLTDSTNSTRPQIPKRLKPSIMTAYSCYTSKLEGGAESVCYSL